MEPREQQDIYESILNTARRTSDGLKSLADNIKKTLEALLAPQYERNSKLQKLAVANVMDPAVARNVAGDDVRNYVEKLQQIHTELSATNKEIEQIQNRLALLQGKTPNDPRLKAAYDQELKELHKLNQDYTNTYRLLQKQAMILSDPKISEKLADVTQKSDMDKALQGIYEKARELKVGAQKKVEAVQKVEEYVRPKLG
jgi:Mg2+ and Co2+ transporter CorA